MDILSAAILGIIEGFTEFLPISSTGHLVIASRLLGVPESDFVKSFIIAIQLGAILAVVMLYWKRFFRDRAALARIVIAFIPTAVIGFALYKIIKGVLFESLATIAAALVVGGVFLVLFEKFHRPATPPESDLARIPYWKAFVIGCAQSLAVVPGVSRSAATVVGGMFLGIERKAIVEFSFLLAVPTMCAATAYDLLKSAGSFTFDQFNLLVFGFIVSFIFAVIGVTFLLRYIQRHSFASFGIYRIVLGLAVLAWLFVH